MNYWIFVTTEYSDYNRGVIEETLETFIKERKWKVGRRTVHRNSVKRGDKIILYITGNNGKKFIANATLDSEFIYKENDLWGYVKVNDINIFQNQVFINPIINNLKFIKNKKHWGIYFQSGIVKITEEDYKTILSKSNTGGLI